jgi:hypothetical protein
MVMTVRDLMGAAYPELLEPSATHVPEIVRSEETRFTRTLSVGLKKLEEELDHLREPAKQVAEQTYGLRESNISCEARRSGLGSDTMRIAAGFHRGYLSRRMRRVEWALSKRWRAADKTLARRERVGRKS